MRRLTKTHASKPLTIVLTFIVMTFAVTLFVYVGLIFLGMSGITSGLSIQLGRGGFFALPIFIGVVAGVLAAFSAARSAKPSYQDADPRVTDHP